MPWLESIRYRASGERFSLSAPPGNRKYLFPEVEGKKHQ